MYYLMEINEFVVKSVKDCEGRPIQFKKGDDAKRFLDEYEDKTYRIVYINQGGRDEIIKGRI